MEKKKKNIHEDRSHNRGSTFTILLFLMHCTETSTPGNGQTRLVEVPLLPRLSHSFPFQHEEMILYHVAILRKELSASNI